MPDSVAIVAEAAQAYVTWNPVVSPGVRFQRPISANTARAYAGDWEAFVSWCADRELAALPANGETVADYIRSREASATWTNNNYLDDGSADRPSDSYAVSTLVRWVSSINVVHRQSGHPPPGVTPEVQSVLTSARRLSSRPPRVMKAVSLDQLRSALQLIDMTSHPAGILGHRDWAILVLGFAGALQRSQLAALTFGDIHFGHPAGIRLRVRTTRAARIGKADIRLLPFGDEPDTCPACALLRWTRLLKTAQARARPDIEQLLLEADTTKHLCRESKIQDQEFDEQSPVFRSLRRGGHVKETKMSAEVVNDVVKRRLAAVGMDPTSVGAHSLRAGFITEALRAGHAYEAVMLQTNHASLLSVEAYQQRSTLHSYRNPVLGLGM